MRRYFIIITLLALFVQCSPKIIPVHKEPRHQPVLKSTNGRVLDIRFPPGDTCLFHEHANNYCYVMLKGGKLATQDQGKEFNSFTLPDAYTGGEFDIPVVSKIHRIVNLEKDTMRFMAVENLRPTTHAIFKYQDHPFQTLVENNITFRVVKLEIPAKEYHSLNFNTPMMMVNRLGKSFILNDFEIDEIWGWWENGGEVSIRNTSSEVLELFCIHLK